MGDNEPATISQSKDPLTTVKTGLHDLQRKVNLNSIKIDLNNVNHVKSVEDLKDKVYSLEHQIPKDFINSSVVKREKETKNEDDDQSEVKGHTDIEEATVATGDADNDDSFEQGARMTPSKLKKMKEKETVLIQVFNIALPTLDVYSDLGLIFRFLRSGDYVWAGLLSVPFLLNYFLSWFLWWSVDKMKSISWIAAMLSCYPQFYAASVIRMLWADFDLGMKKKRKMERNISEFEVFAESVFTVLVITYIWQRAAGVLVRDPLVRERVIGKYGSFEETFFYFTYATSILTASLGLSKCLKVGPCRVLGEGGALGGFVTGRFILLMLSVGSTLIGKGMIFFFSLVQYNHNPSDIFIDFFNVILALSCTFLPGLLLSLWSHRGIFNKYFLHHPSLLLMPVFTHYTFTVNQKWCSGRDEDGSNDRITFSRRWTIANIAVSATGLVAFGVIYALVSDNSIWDIVFSIWDIFKFLIIFSALSQSQSLAPCRLCYSCSWTSAAAACPSAQTSKWQFSKSTTRSLST